MKRKNEKDYIGGENFAYQGFLYSERLAHERAVEHAKSVVDAVLAKADCNGVDSKEGRNEATGCHSFKMETLERNWPRLSAALDKRKNEMPTLWR